MSRNSTDYEFPAGWGLMSDAEKCEWYKQERAFRQACRQRTVWADKHTRLGTDDYKYE